jgi:DNA repair photolyase
MPEAGSEAEFQDALPTGPIRGRGAGLNPGNRFEDVRLHVLGEHVDEIVAEGADGQPVTTRVYRDAAKSVLNPVDSPDICFKWSVNPYRGCEHGCVYCYARPNHEYLGLSSGLDFETKILAKLDAPEILRRELTRPSWSGDGIAISGVTDPYQPIEAKLRITRRVLELFAELAQPVSLVTKNRLITRDIDLLGELAKHNAASAAISITSLDNRLSSKMEPRASSPRDRLEAVRRLADAGVPVTVMVAPIIPALNESEVPAILKAAADAGATSAGSVLLRLPHQIKALFFDWLAREFPERAAHVEAAVRDTRGGELYQTAWRVRQRGTGPRAEQVGQLFNLFAKKHGLNAREHADGRAEFLRRKALREAKGQLGLFG